MLSLSPELLQNEKSSYLEQTQRQGVGIDTPFLHRPNHDCVEDKGVSFLLVGPSRKEQTANCQTKIKIILLFPYTIFAGYI
jgi:hypothetical protein